MTATTYNEAIEAVANALIELAYFAPLEMSKSGHKQICLKASQLNVFLGKKSAVTSLYIRV